MNRRGRFSIYRGKVHVVLIQENTLVFSEPKKNLIIICLHIHNNHKAIIFSEYIGQNHRVLFPALQNSGSFVCMHSLVS